MICQFNGTVLYALLSIVSHGKGEGQGIRLVTASNQTVYIKDISQDSLRAPGRRRDRSEESTRSS